MNVAYRPELDKIQPYVPGKPIEEVKREFGLEDVIKLASNENPLGPSPKAKAAVMNWLNAMHIYPDGGAYDLRRALAAKLGVDPNQLIFGNGSDESIKTLAEAFLTPGSSVVMATPTFSVYRSTSLLMGAVPIEVPLRDFRHNLMAMADAVTDSTRLVYICNPNNPTGTIVTGREIDKFLQDLPSHVVVVFDEAYKEFVEAEEYPETLELIDQAEQPIVVLRTFSKIYGLAGLRLGYAVAKPEIIQVLEHAREPFNTNGAAQAAAIAALADEAHVQASRELVIREKQYLYREFRALNLQFVPSEANFILVDVEQDCKEVYTALLRLGVIVRTADIFGYPTSLRISVGTHEQNVRLLSALRKVLNR